ncbi:MAG: hypothetical protein JW871_02030 [Endomicrobiales bacterium]|nr:hypothetical protein [Endomicrobiales bacterium]
MKTCRLIISKPMTGPENMALDEAIFLASEKTQNPASTFRLYTWKDPCTTIGYFQKYNDFLTPHVLSSPLNREEEGEGKKTHLPIVRRLTGGLAVNHKNDLSYAFITNKKQWPWLYNQEKSYYSIHSVIKEALKNLDIETDFFSASGKSRNNLCAETAFKYDLNIDGKKILGSCQRKRKNYLLQQGSIYTDIILTQQDKARAVADSFKEAFKKLLKFELEILNPTREEVSFQQELINSKYMLPGWNQKF